MNAALAAALHDAAPLAVAVSGGVDSMTLMTAAHRLLGTHGVMAVHASSAAVPAEATARVEAQAAADGWAVQVVAAGEFDDPAYLANPVNRCFHCKTNLYATIARVTDRGIASGANLDDLGDYRPGLDAARDHGVRHPLIEAGMGKAAVRALARSLGLGGIAELPAAPCLASRIETGIAIDADELAFVHRAEQLVGAQLGGTARAVRCRVRAAGVVIELDVASLAAISASAAAVLAAAVAADVPSRLAGRPVSFAAYRTGSAFLVNQP